MSDGSSQRAASQAMWDRYWDHGFLTSCADAFQGNYAGSIERFWRERFATLPDGARILDICTGNGAVAALAAGVSREQGQSLDIHAIDLAEIHPEIALAAKPELLERIRFYSRTSADNTPFDPHSFDAICGQYALEYTPVAATIAEIARLAAPGCRVWFIVHHDESIVLTTAREELANGALILDESGLFDAARPLIDKVASAAGPEGRRALAADPVAETYRARLNAAAGTVTAKLEHSPHPELLRNALGYVRQAYEAALAGQPAVAAAALGRGQAEIRANVERLGDLASAALDRPAADGVLAQLSAAGLISDPLDTLYHDAKRLMGWVISAHMPA